MASLHKDLNVELSQGSCCKNNLLREVMFAISLPLICLSTQQSAQLCKNITTNKPAKWF